MADTTDTPPPPPAEKPVAPRRRAVRKAGAKTPSTNAPAKTDAPKPKVAVKPRSSKRATPRTATKPTKPTSSVVEPGATKSASAKKTSTRKKSAARTSNKWGVAKIVGGVAVAGAAAAALLSLRGSSEKTLPKSKSAHQPDGTDSSKSFSAGVADENTIPDEI